MQTLDVPVPETLRATYLIPVRAQMTEAAARRRIIKAVGTRTTGPLRALLLEWIRQGLLTTQMLPPTLNRTISASDDVDSVLGKQLMSLARARAFVLISVTRRASIIGVHEWLARGSAAALAAELVTPGSEVPVIGAHAQEMLTPKQALASLPALAYTPGNDLSIGFSLYPWVTFHDLVHQGRYWAVSDGMCRFGLPEFRVGGVERDLRQELKEILFGVTFRVWSDLVKRAQATPGATGLMASPRHLQLPAELDIHRKHLDAARGVPNRGGAWTTIGLRLDPAANWLTVCPHSDWDMGWEHFVADLCHAMFAYEKPPLYYLPVYRALHEAARSIPEARRRFNDGELPPGSLLMVRYSQDDDAFRWARVESWADDDLAIVQDSGRELAPPVRPGPSVTIGSERIMDWAIWVDGKGAVEGARTENVGPGF
jgi:hypothetical protein